MKTYSVQPDKRFYFEYSTKNSKHSAAAIAGDIIEVNKGNVKVRCGTQSVMTNNRTFTVDEAVDSGILKRIH